ncbi:hypothetical protein K5D56_26115 [Pseudomonas cichorii]|nr:hypothetical protein [Pseudomonas cichorii]MBX8592854.1 hypothetical protein [Pseudomonas cichorii]
MNLKRLILILFPCFLHVPARRSDGDNVARKIVRRLSRGNINLSLGRYMTAADLEARKKKLNFDLEDHAE